MDNNILEKIPQNICNILKNKKNISLRPCQEKAIKEGLFENNKNFLITTPTGSGKTMVAELAMLNTILNQRKKVIYIVPLKALASEKYKEFMQAYSKEIIIKLSVGDIQDEKYSYNCDLLITTSEKLDSLIRHDTNIIDNVGLVIADEIHLLNDEKRGPTLEILLSIFKTKFKQIRIIGLSATIGNSKEISKWLNATLIEDDWRPVELQHFILEGNELIRYK